MVDRLSVGASVEQLEAELARRYFSEFVRLVHPEYRVQWFQALIMERLGEAGDSAEDRRLGFALPPGHGKSEYACLFCAWMMTRDPDVQILYVTYGAEFARTKLETIRKVFELDTYRRLFGDKQANRAKSELAERKRSARDHLDIIGGEGFVKAVGFSGGITGGRYDIIVIDDPYKSTEDAGSPTTRDKRWREYSSAIKTRRRPGRTFHILMLFTRWHEDDLTGRAKLIEGDDWSWVELEALKTDDQLGDDDVEQRDPRAPGDALWPSAASRESLELARERTPEIFQCVYQGRPVPLGGHLYRGELIARHEAIPACAGRWVQSWDLRAGGRADAGSYAVGILGFVPDHEPTRVYLAEVVRGRWSPDETLEVFDRMQGQPRWSSSALRLIEEKADGVTIMSLRRRRYVGMIGVKPTRDKLSRARLVQPLIHAGQLSLPTRAHWLAEYLLELLTFPGAATDDQVDATSQLLTHLFIEEDEQQDAAALWRAMMG